MYNMLMYESLTLLISVEFSINRIGGQNCLQLNTMASSIPNPMAPEPSTPPRISRSEMVHFILNKHNGKCRYNDLVGNKTFNFKNKKEIKHYIESLEGRGMFRIKPMFGGDLVCVTLSEVQLCTNYGRGSSFCNSSCNKFHLCDLGLLGNCTNKDKCNFFHNLQNEHNKNLVKKMHLDDITEYDILLFLKLQQSAQHKSGVIKTDVEANRL